MRLTLLALLSLTACPGPVDDSKPEDTSVVIDDTDTDTVDTDTGDTDTVDTDTGDTDAPIDADGDGFDAASDCDDTDAAVHPGADELCNEVDDDCDGTIDPATALDALTVYLDSDGDGFGEAGTSWLACVVDAGGSLTASDCDDADVAYNPLADESDCTDPADYNCDGSVGYADADADGFAACADCDDSSATTFPGAAETCNTVDDDCDGTVDQGALDAATWYADADADGFGDAAVTMAACDAPGGFTADATDCDDATASTFPGAAETCNAVDDDCDGTVDPASATDVATWYADVDADGFGDAAVTVAACDAPGGFTADATDCDDADAAYNPGAIEADCTDPADYNCDGSTGYADADADGFAACEECDDTDANTFPGADEVCNDRDDDCDGTIDQGALDAPIWYADVDADGFGDAATTVAACDAPSGFTADAADCDDASADTFPGAEEICNTIDDDCDGTVDPATATDAGLWYADVDGDGFGDAADAVNACSAPAGRVANADDCDDTTAMVSPDATEICDTIDDDCDGTVDPASAADAPIWYADVDADGFGNAAMTLAACDAPAGYLADATDCDDTTAATFPAATEICDAVDNDCDGTVDPASATDAPIWYADADADGFGNAAMPLAACDAPAGYLADATDCDDTTAATFPGATEICNTIDDDCDGTVDIDAYDATAWYADADADGAGDSDYVSYTCDAPDGFVATGGDCDDTDAGAQPGGDELCDGTDNDCNGEVDESAAADAITWYADADSDGYGDVYNAGVHCVQPLGYVADDRDCVDDDGAVNPGAPELCDGADNNCDGTTDTDALDAPTWYADADGDEHGDPADIQRACTVPAGYLADASDCDGTDGAIYPGAAEYCNTTDDDCDGLVDEAAVDMEVFYQDRDGDGVGTDSSTSPACALTEGYAAINGDCDDDAAATYPGAPEVCEDGIDQDCSGLEDDEPSCYGCFEFDDYVACSPLPWENAAEVCARLGSNLPTVDDAAENTALVATMNRWGAGNSWLGVSDLAVEGEFVWEDGSAPGFTNWGSGEPNNGAGIEHCGAIDGDGGSWTDWPCDMEMYFLCE